MGEPSPEVEALTIAGKIEITPDALLIDGAAFPHWITPDVTVSEYASEVPRLYGVTVTIYCEELVVQPGNSQPVYMYSPLKEYRHEDADNGRAG